MRLLSFVYDEECNYISKFECFSRKQLSDVVYLDSGSVDGDAQGLGLHDARGRQVAGSASYSLDERSVLVRICKRS